MKKALCLFVACIMFFSVFALTASADANRTEELLDRVKNSGEVSVTVRSGSTFLGSSTSTYYIKGNSVAYDFSNGFFNIRIVMRDGTAYAYLPSLPLFYVKLDGTDIGNINVKFLLQSAVGITKGVTHYETSFDETVDGVLYSVDQYNDGATVKLKFYYLGDELKFLNVTDRATGSVQNTYFENVSFTVDDSDVAVPTGVNVTPFLKILFLLALAQGSTLV